MSCPRIVPRLLPIFGVLSINRGSFLIRKRKRNPARIFRIKDLTMIKILYSSIFAVFLLLASCTPTKTQKYVYIPPPKLKQIEIYVSSSYICVQPIPRSQEITVDNSFNHNNVKCPDGTIYGDMAESSTWLPSVIIDKNNVEHKGSFKTLDDCIALTKNAINKLFAANPITGFNVVLSCEKKVIETYDTKLYDLRKIPFRNA